jgi:siroheme synthase-like protein
MTQNKKSGVEEEKQNSAIEQGNNLFPIFLKLEKLRLLIVGGGKVALEKLHAVLQNSPATQITMVAVEFTEPTRNTAIHHENVELIERAYEASDLDDADVIIIAVDDAFASEQIYNDAHEKGKLVNVADKPDLCDFYLGSIVKKGNLKIAISTNGKSPVIAKRLKETFNDLLPGELDEVLNNMEVIRNKMKGDFATKVNKLNKITKVLTINKGVETSAGEKRWRKIATYSVLAFFFMLLGHFVLSYIPFHNLQNSFVNMIRNLDKRPHS